MPRPFLTLGPKEFLTGIAPNAHTEGGGLFFKANGITPLFDAGGNASKENGLLQAGPAPTDFTSNVVVDAIIGGTTTNYTATPYLYMIGKDGHFYKKGLGSAAVTDLRSGTPITNPHQFMTVWGPAGGTGYLYYWNNGHIGTWNMSGTYPTDWNDSAYVISDGNPVVGHQFVGNVYYAASNERIGALLDDGASGVTHDDDVLDFPSRTNVTAMTDDGRYLVMAVTQNPFGSDFFAKNKILFWDTFSPKWDVEWLIPDPYIFRLESIGSTIYAYGQYGIWEGNFAVGFKKIISRMTGTSTLSDFGNSAKGYGVYRGATYNGQALVIATDSTVDTYGKLQPELPSAYFKHFKIPSGTTTFMNASFDPGRIFVGTTTPKLYAFDFNGATHDSGNTAQTVYIRVPERVKVHRIDLVFGEPLATGDAISAGIYKDEDTASTDYGSATYAQDGAVRRKSLFGSALVEGQLSLLLTFTSGAVKLKRVEFFGDARD